MEASRAALQACLPEACGVLMYPLQLLIGNVPLAAIVEMPATILQSAVAGREPMSAASIPSVSDTPAPLTGTKQWHCSYDQEVSMPRPEEEETTELDITPKSHFTGKGRMEDPL